METPLGGHGEGRVVRLETFLVEWKPDPGDNGATDEPALKPS